MLRLLVSQRSLGTVSNTSEELNLHFHRVILHLLSSWLSSCRSLIASCTMSIDLLQQFGGRDLHGSLFLLRSGLVEWTLRGLTHYQNSNLQCYWPILHLCRMDFIHPISHDLAKPHLKSYHSKIKLTTSLCNTLLFLELRTAGSSCFLHANNLSILMKFLFYRKVNLPTTHTLAAVP